MKLVAVCLLLSLSSLAQDLAIEARLRVPATPVATFRTVAEEVRVAFTVTDANHSPVAGVTQEQIVVLEDGQPVRALTSFYNDQDLPLRVALLLDDSDSGHTQKAERQRACTTFFRTVLGGRDVGAVVRFAAKADFRTPFTGDIVTLESAVAHPGTPGMTSLFDTIVAASERVSHEAQGVGRTAFLLISDGGDNLSAATLDRAVEAALRAGVVIYGVTFRDYTTTKEGIRNIAALADRTGGRAFVVKEQELPSVLDAIAQELRSQYIVAFRPQRSGASHFRTLKVVAAAREGWTVRARTGYFAGER